MLGCAVSGLGGERGMNVYTHLNASKREGVLTDPGADLGELVEEVAIEHRDCEQ